MWTLKKWRRSCNGTRIVKWMSADQSTITAWYRHKSCYQCAEGKAPCILYFSSRWRLMGNSKMRPHYFQRKGYYTAVPIVSTYMAADRKITAPAGYRTPVVQEVPCMRHTWGEWDIRMAQNKSNHKIVHQFTHFLHAEIIDTLCNKNEAPNIL